MAKGKNPTGKKVTRKISFPLTEEQKSAKGSAAAKLQEELDAVVEKRDTMMKDFKAKITGFTTRIRTFLSEIHKGIEERETDCTEVKNFDNHTIEYWVSGKIMDKRDMNEEDRQLELDDAAKKKSKVWRGPRIAKSEEVNEVGEVIKMQTNKKTAHSSVNP